MWDKQHSGVFFLFASVLAQSPNALFLRKNCFLRSLLTLNSIQYFIKVDQLPERIFFFCFNFWWLAWQFFVSTEVELNYFRRKWEKLLKKLLLSLRWNKQWKSILTIEIDRCQTRNIDSVDDFSSIFLHVNTKSTKINICAFELDSTAFFLAVLICFNLVLYFWQTLSAQMVMGPRTKLYSFIYFYSSCLSAVFLWLFFSHLLSSLFIAIVYESKSRYSNERFRLGLSFAPFFLLSVR